MQGCFKNRKKIERDRRKFVKRDALKNRKEIERELGIIKKNRRKFI